MSSSDSPQAHADQALLSRFAEIDKLNSDLRLIRFEFQAACMHFQDAVVAAEWAFLNGANDNSQMRKQPASHVNLAEFIPQVSTQLHKLAAKYQDGEKLGCLRGLQKMLGSQVPAELAEKELDAECEARVKLYNDIRENVNTLDKFNTLLRGLDFKHSRRPEAVIAETQEKLVGVFQYFMEGIATASAQDDQDARDGD